MKLQYLGDSRDAFKWDLLHWLCTQSRPGFSSLVFVPLLTPDDANPTDGRTPHHRFACRSEIRTFVASLAREPKSLDVIRELGRLDRENVFDVAAAVAEPNLAFVILARDLETGRQIGDAAETYCAGHSSIRYVPMKGRG